MDGRAHPLMDRKVLGACAVLSGCSGHETHNCYCRERERECGSYSSSDYHWLGVACPCQKNPRNAPKKITKVREVCVVPSQSFWWLILMRHDVLNWDRNRPHGGTVTYYLAEWSCHISTAKEFRNAYNACTVELLFGLACSTVLWRKPSLCLLVFPVIGVTLSITEYETHILCCVVS